MAAIDKRSNGRWRVRIRNRRAPALSITFTRKADAIKCANIDWQFKYHCFQMN